MKKLLIAVCLIAVVQPALGDGTATLISWPSWQCASTEDLSLGRKHTSFPLTYLFDGNPATAWVFSGTGKHELSGRKGYALHLSIDEDKMKPVNTDSIWIMNGYNKSKALFLRNNRITELKLFVNGKLLKTVSLADSMGWHKISIPRQYVFDMYLQFTKFAKGRDNDVCVSELALYDQGKKIDLKMPQAVVYTDGDVDCGDGQVWSVISRSGKTIVTNDSDGWPEWSNDGSKVAGIGCIRNRYNLWVVEARTGRIIHNIASAAAQDALAPVWVNENTIRLTPDPESKTGTLIRLKKGR